MKMGNMMVLDETSQQMDYILENCKKSLLSFYADFIGKENTKLRICYPAVAAESNKF